MTGDQLKQDVLAWIEENRGLENHPLAWRLSLAERLATHPDMAAAWKELAMPEHGVRAGRNVMSFTFQAFEDANKECRRLPSDDERKRIGDVEKALDKLRTAIARAPFLDSAHPVEIEGRLMAFAWRESGLKAAESQKAMPPLCLDGLLEFAQSAIPDIAARQPPRTIKRQKDTPEIAAFVRHLAARFQDRYGSKLMGTIAHITNATYNPPDPVTKQQVERILSTPSQ